MSENDLGSLQFSQKTFRDIDAVFARFYEPSFQALGDRQRSNLINRVLLDLIQKEPEPAFLLREVLDFVERVDRENLLNHYIFTSFELWLNQYSDLSFEENYRVRAKIAGKYVPREAYQAFFPIGMGKTFPGTHFVTAHKSPDLDTTIASFWGWVDAFAARVGTGLHIWNVPGGPPPSQIEVEILFREIFGGGIFSHVAKTRTILSLTGNDLMTQQDLLRKRPADNMSSLHATRTNKAIVVVDSDGYYLGDFRTIDAQGVRQVLSLLHQCLRWFENRLHIELITLFSEEDLRASCLTQFVDEIFSTPIASVDQGEVFGDEEKERLSLLMREVFGLSEGIEASFAVLAEALKKEGSAQFANLQEMIRALKYSDLFDFSGCLIEDRSRIFSSLASLIAALHESIQEASKQMDQLSWALRIKKEVFAFSPKFVSVRSDVEEIRSKMGSYQYLTVNYPDKDRLFPVGVIPALELRKKTLGTVSLRDFSNSSEMTIPSYLEVISIIDHHKTTGLTTVKPPVFNIKNVESSNSIVADLTLAINGRYSTSGLCAALIEKQQKEESDPALLERLWSYQVVLRRNEKYYVHPEREQIEYLHFLYGILDDTDLLSKVSNADVETIARLLNRLKTLFSGKEQIAIDLEDIPKNASYARQAADRILEHPDMRALYYKMYLHREKDLEEQLLLCAAGKESHVFSDTKELNRLARVGQTKLFAKNIPALQANKASIRAAWYAHCRKFFADHPDTDLYLHMISTVSMERKEVEYTHEDELWVWPAPTDLAIEHLKRFLSAFQAAPELQEQNVRVSFLGKDCPELKRSFKESFMQTQQTTEDEGMPIAIIHYRAGSINSRKSMISPYLPILSK
ncbi:MAG: hypothetical protein AAGF04_02865 [Chlamydiota bacterium]